MSYGSIAVVLGILTSAMSLRICLPNRWTVGLFATTVAGLSCFLLLQHGNDISQGWAAARSDVENFVSSPLGTHPEHVWPPQIGQTYPDLQLIDQQGRRTSLSEFRGKVILLEPIGIPCPACIAFSGGQSRGAYNGVAPQRGLQSIDDYALQYGQVDLDRDDIVLVQIVFYGPNMTAPTADDVRDWAAHFGFERAKRRIVLAAEPYLLGADTRAMIPGFQLIDKDFVLRYDSAGHAPRHNLYTELLPGIRRLCSE